MQPICMMPQFQSCDTRAKPQAISLLFLVSLGSVDRQETGSKAPLLFYFDQGSSQIEDDRSGAVCHEQND